ncbi:SHPS1 phosphatase, partial [Rhinopomastus cyanomelas]|nr:SHPS1 phosphatase [Rhinopomastus cyanomelas]
QSFQLRQPQDKVSLIAGQTLNLTCTVSGSGPIGPIKWLKGLGSGNKIIYEDKGTFSRVMRIQDESNTDFSIRIESVRPEDTGTYYCVKFSKSVDGLEVFQRGSGTEVSVLAQPSFPVVSGPDKRTKPGEAVRFSCATEGFFPANISVKWLKDKDPLSAHVLVVTQSQSSYNMFSNVSVTLQAGDVRTNLTCEVKHLTLSKPLKATYPLRNALRVPPSVYVVPGLHSSIEVNKTMNFSCHVEGFYPSNVTITWLENGVEIKAANISQLVETSQGLFKQWSLVEVQATQEKNGSVFCCQVVHDGQELINTTATLRITVP